MSIKASNQITVVDIEDVGRLSVYLNSNLPLSTIYDPNSNSYAPNWQTTNLKLTPVIYLNDKALALNASGLALTWKRREGSSSEGNLTVGETVSGGILTVNQNKLSTVSSGLLSYICYVSYKDPDSGVTVNAQSLLSFSLLQNAVELHYCSIDGANVFLYNSAGNLMGDSQITLTANLSNVTITNWQYKKADGTFAVYPTTSDNQTISGSTLIVKPAHAIFFNDIAVVKLVTNDVDVYDTITIAKLRDGSHSVIGALNNDSHTLPANSAGTITSYAGADSTLSIYENGSDITSTFSITTTPSSGVTGTQSADKKTYTVTGMTVDTGYVDFVATRAGYATITKRFALSRVKGGASGSTARVYFLDSDTLVLNKNISNVFTPSNVTFSSFYRDGTSANRTAYSGRFIIAESTDGTTFTNKYTSTADEAAKTYTPSATNIAAVKCTLYASGGVTNALDTQTVMVAKDGATGATGAGGISVVVGNENQGIPCNSSGNVSPATDVTIPFYGYQGTTRIACSVTAGTLPSGVTVKSNTASTTSAAGSLVLAFAVNATLGDSAAMSGTIDLTFNCGGQSIVKKFSWQKNKAAVNGTNSVLFELISPAGNVIVNSANNVSLETIMYSGTSVVTPTAFVWKKYASGAWTVISGQTASKLTVTPAMVDGSASFSCTGTYDGKTYTAYATVIDKQDNYDVDVICTLGTQIKNGMGSGVIYYRLYQNGSEVDVLKSTNFSSTAPSSPATGAFYYHIDVTAKTVTLKKYNGTAWADATGADLPSETYKTYRLDKNSLPMDDGNVWKTGKVVYIDGSMIDSKCTFVVEVE
ncbi:hypothetical protein [Robinsoniella peoriensis]|uniref:hypothetical protein n=1 Tax=Robinsoniella peoriensis TaxID=180332 RepID=UPI00364371DD